MVLKLENEDSPGKPRDRNVKFKFQAAFVAVKDSPGRVTHTSITLLP